MNAVPHHHDLYRGCAVPHDHDLFRGCPHIQEDCRGRHIQSAETNLTLENHLPFSFLPPCPPLPCSCVLQVPREYEGGCWILWGCHWVRVLGTDLQSFAEQQAFCALELPPHPFL